jgi:hypothetical protein
MNESLPISSYVDFDTQNLRIQADFDVAVADDVFWVPVNTLGSTRYTNDEIRSLLKCSPEEKQIKIATLYEAIQLYQLGNFKGVIDSIVCIGKTSLWEYKKPGFHCVRTNEGCCASDSNWLAYLLNSKYDEVGFFNFSNKNTSGHVTNYIHHDGWYYFIDMMMYRLDSLPYSGIETGLDTDYRTGPFISGYFHRSRSPQSFVNYYLKNLQEKPILFLLLQQKEMEAMGVQFRVDEQITEMNFSQIIENGYDLLCPENTNFRVLYRDDHNPVQIYLVDPPVCLQNWQDLPDEAFHL